MISSSSPESTRCVLSLHISMRNQMKFVQVKSKGPLLSLTAHSKALSGALKGAKSRADS